jgi:hypothetical protein
MDTWPDQTDGGHRLTNRRPAAGSLFSVMMGELDWKAYSLLQKRIPSCCVRHMQFSFFTSIPFSRFLKKETNCFPVKFRRFGGNFSFSGFCVHLDESVNHPSMGITSIYALPAVTRDADT